MSENKDQNTEPLDPIARIAEALTVANKAYIDKGDSTVIKSVIQLANDEMNKATQAEQLEAQRAFNYTTLRENFKDCDKDQLLKHLNRINEAIAAIVRSAMNFEDATENYNKACEIPANDAGVEPYTLEELDRYDDLRSESSKTLIDVIKAFHNSAPEEHNNRLDAETTKA